MLHSVRESIITQLTCILAIYRDFRLEHLMDLNLHEFSDEVLAIVERAGKELGMEAYLTNTLDKTWSSAKFEYGQHPSGCALLQPTEQTLQDLEDHQVT